ncbi:MAG TPA: MarR family winged helix-turn-helix transcriptional regulator [Azospirillaceae bacterium]|nr:MarR family winged helix-turn-helix transcriptional regulator [Azospirillaceae bacterium]
MTVDPSLIEDVRAASRAMVRELGFMRSTLAATDYSPSAVHALMEIGARGVATAAQLAPLLRLEKSSVSRMIAKLIKAGELREAAGGGDSRVKELSLTPQGARTVADIHAFGRNQATAALALLAPDERRTVAQGLAAYAQALRASGADSADTGLVPSIDIVAG